MVEGEVWQRLRSETRRRETGVAELGIDGAGETEMWSRYGWFERQVCSPLVSEAAPKTPMRQIRVKGTKYSS